MGLVFTPVIDALAGTLIVSNSAVASGLTLGTKTIQIVGSGEMSIDGGGWVSSGVVQNGTAVRLRITTPSGELGQVTTVTVDLQSVGYVEWSVTNRNTLMAEIGTGYDDLMGFSVLPGQPIEESANASDELFDGNFSFVEENGVGFDAASYAVTTGEFVNEAGNGTGVGFSAPELLVAEVATGADSLFGALILQMNEVATAADDLDGTLSLDEFVSEQGFGKDAIVTQSSTEQIDEDGFGADHMYVNVLATETVFEFSAVGTDDLVEAAAPGWMVEEGGTASDELLPVNNVTINFNNVGYGFDDTLLSYPTHGAWAFNSRSMAMSRWEALQVTEVHEANGVVYGLADDGIYVLSSTVAADAELESGLYDFGVIETKHLRHLYITYTATAPIHVGLIRSNGGGKQRVMYGKPSYVAENPMQTRINLGRGPLARYWGMTLNNTDGGFASVKDMRLVPNVTTRRI